MARAAATTHADGEVLLLVGTTKGAFLLWSDASRRAWRVDGPHFKGQSVYSLAYDDRGGRRRIFAGTRSFHWGSVLRASDDFGKSWSAPDRQNVRFPDGSDLALTQIWQIAAGGPAASPDTMYCGVEPAALFESRDAGETWSVVQGLLDHEHRTKWQPGFGGLGLHTIVVDPTDARRMLVAISSGGAYRTDDGGRTWTARNVGVRAEFMPNKYPEFGQCVHKVVHHPSRPERLFLQNHWGLYRSDDWGDTWHDVANGVPSDFGFAMQMHPHDPDTVYIVPIESDEFRCVPEAKLRVYRTRDAGASWHPLASGLPQHDAYETVLRDSLAADSLGPAGVYFGTRSGKLYASANDGEQWTEIANGLPSITCVKAAVVRS
ncbi:MAG TPA: exo-alpha-sialidase [Gemmatimonadaceae bacterium]|nr:exo-alpha-sialidase [Gemmatimonadaceae bacterium]